MPTTAAATLRSGRSTHLDVLRAVAAVMVIGYHANGLVGGSGDGGVLWLRYNVDSGVELFFVLSGYLIALPFLRALVAGNPAPDTLSYVRRRAARILPGYWLALLVATFVATREPGAVPPLGLLLPQIGLLQGVIPGDAGGPLVVAWTLSVEAAFYDGVPLATWALFKRRAAWSIPSLVALTFAVWVGSAAVACSFATFVPAGSWTTVVLRGPAGLLCQFCPGILVALIHIRAERAGVHAVMRSRVAWMLIAGGVLGWILVAAWTGSSASTIQVVVRNQLCGALFGMVLLGTLELRGAESRAARLVARVGTVSYGMYLWHWLALEVIASTGLHIALPVPGIGNWALSTALLAAATLPIAMLSWRLVETSAIRWASDRSASRRTVAVNTPALAPPLRP